ncbi:stage VI sporulation protein D [Bacillus sp. NPDC077027]|uniref:stage VI sporulation protein D n=1 Tax=Bacillus sp. NPDC077027 TaxID=3390548 RepID=UPI003CFC6C98
MSQNNRLQFSVEESIYFKNGQEVSELLSISLDPDILVQEVNDYVSIRGSLELTGEYNINQEELLGESSSYVSYRQAEDVKIREDGTAELLHQFPVDITIPKNKINHLSDVFVFIDAFDYQLTDSRLLTIQADLAIEGLLGEEETEESEQDLYEIGQRADLEYGDVSYEVEQDAIVEESAEEEPVAESEEESSFEQDEPEEEALVGYRSLPEAPVQEPPFFDPPKLLEEEERNESFFEVEVRREPEEDIEEEESEPYSESPVFETPAYHFEPIPKERDHGLESEVEAEEPQEELRQSSSGSENSLYLTKLFAKQEEEDFSRMKICIVQQEDTIDRICERYQLNVQHLLRTNSLSVDAELEEGQILYIPEYQKSNA